MCVRELLPDSEVVCASLMGAPASPLAYLLPTSTYVLLQLSLPLCLCLSFPPLLPVPSLSPCDCGLRVAALAQNQQNMNVQYTSETFLPHFELATRRCISFFFFLLQIFCSLLLFMVSICSNDLLPEWCLKQGIIVV